MSFKHFLILSFAEGYTLDVWQGSEYVFDSGVFLIKFKLIFTKWTQQMMIYFRIRNLHEFHEFWVDSRKFMMAKILFLLVLESLCPINPSEMRNIFLADSRKFMFTNFFSEICAF